MSEAQDLMDSIERRLERIIAANSQMTVTSTLAALEARITAERKGAAATALADATSAVFRICQEVAKKHGFSEAVKDFNNLMIEWLKDTAYEQYDGPKPEDYDERAGE